MGLKKGKGGFMNIHNRRNRLGITTRELAKEAGVSPSSVSRLETEGGDWLNSTKRKVLKTLTRLEAQGIPLPDSKKARIPRGKYGGQGRRRPDLVAARGLLGLSQRDLVGQLEADDPLLKVNNQEISKIESGYAAHDPKLEGDVEAYLRLQLEAKGIPWPDVPKPSDTELERLQRAAREGTFKPGAAKRLAKAIFPDPPKEGVTTCPPCPFCHGYHDVGIDCQSCATPLSKPAQKAIAAYNQYKAASCPACPACRGARVVWNPATGEPHKCPLCK
jgi:transcriptional regulator with XRE-family HTH domain